MNLEEAHNNIGAEVELDESTKPYTFIDDDEVLKAEYSIIKGSMKIFSCMNDGNVVVVSDDGIVKEWYLPKHLKLKPQNYKIHVLTEAESREAQELFFELGYEWMNSEKYVQHTDIPYLYSYNDEMKIAMGWSEELFESHKNKQIILQDLREMVAKKKGIKSIGVDLASGEDKTVKSCIEPHKEMKWENALRAVADGKEVEILDSYGNWERIGDFYIDAISSGEFDFRLAPQRIKLNGEYTKEELLQKIGEME